VLEVVERLCERVGIIHEGKLIAEGLMADMRGAAETLEDAFVRALGMEHAPRRWTGCRGRARKTCRTPPPSSGLSGALSATSIRGAA